jgi:hypothetical protein
MMDGMTGVADYQCERLLGARYHRLAPFLPERVPMDAFDKSEDLKRYASEVRLTRTWNWLRREFL